MTDIGSSVETRSLGPAIDVQIMPVPFLAVTLQPTLGDWPYKAAPGCEVDVFGRSVFLRKYSLNYWERREEGYICESDVLVGVRCKSRRRHARAQPSEPDPACE